MYTSIRNVSLVLFAVVSTSATTSYGGDLDLKPILGRGLEMAIEQVTPSAYRQGVSTEKLTISDRGTVKGRVKVKYRHRVSTYFGKKTLWEATVRVHWTSYYANGHLTNFRVDVGKFKGVINTQSIQSRLGRWLRQQANYFGRYVRKPNNHSARRINARVVNHSNRTVYYTIIAKGSGGRVEPNRLAANFSRGHSWLGTMTLRYSNGLGQWRNVPMVHGRTYTFRLSGNAIELVW